MLFICIIIIIIIICCTIITFNKPLKIVNMIMILLVLNVTICILNIPILYKIIISSFLFYIYSIYYSFLVNAVIIYIEYVLLHNNINLQKRIYSTLSKTFKIKHNFHDLPPYPTIIVCNYCFDRLENILCKLLPIHICIVMSSKMFFLDMFSANNIYLKSKGAYKTLESNVIKYNKEGKYIFLYTSKYSDKPNTVINIKSGAFSISKSTHIPITLMTIDHIDFGLFNTIPYQNLQIHIGETFVVDNVFMAKCKARTYFRDTLSKFATQKYQFVD